MPNHRTGQRMPNHRDGQRMPNHRTGQRQLRNAELTRFGRAPTRLDTASLLMSRCSTSAKWSKRSRSTDTTLRTMSCSGGPRYAGVGVRRPQRPFICIQGDQRHATLTATARSTPGTARYACSVGACARGSRGKVEVKVAICLRLQLPPPGWQYKHCLTMGIASAASFRLAYDFKCHIRSAHSNTATRGRTAQNRHCRTGRV